MARNKKYDDDDGRIVADMSGIERQSLIIPRFGKKENKMPLSDPEEESSNPWENNKLSKQERRAFVTGALGATIAIGSVFVIAAALLILFITKVYG